MPPLGTTNSELRTPNAAVERDSVKPETAVLAQAETGNRKLETIPTPENLERISHTPAFQKFVKDNFPSQMPLLANPTSRRRFLNVMGASMALAGLNGCFWPEAKVAPEATRPDGRAPGVPVNYATCFELGGVAEGILVKSYDGRPIKIEGNPKHPMSGGASSAFAQALLLEMYDPGRSQHVIRRQNNQTISAEWSDFAAAIKDLPAKKGKGLAILSEASSSITLADMRKRLSAALPESKWYEYEPIQRENASRDFRPLYDLSKADLIVCFDADILGTDPAALKYTREFAARRNPDKPMCKLVVVESGWSITGAMADQRIVVKPSELTQLHYGFVATVQKLQDAPPLPEPLKRLAELVQKNPDASLVILGEQYNSVLHGSGFTPCHWVRPEAGKIQDLASAIDKGEVETLLILGGNPVYNAPADLAFADKLKKVATTAHLSLYDDETSKACGWHLPRAHALEAWDDAGSRDGTRSIQQPLIEPLYGGKTSTEVVAIVLGDALQKSYDLVQRAIKEKEIPWTKQALHDGVIERIPGLQEAIFKPERPNVSPAPGLEVLFTPDYRVYDGRFANNGWLQELPDPISKLTWDNAAYISPATAKAQNVAHADMVKLELDGRSLEIAVFVLAGIADNTVVLPLGYGRNFGGAVADGVGFNTYVLRTTKAMYAASGAKMTRTGATYKFATTQDHKIVSDVAIAGAAERVPLLVRSGDLKTYQADRNFAKKIGEEAPVGERASRPLEVGERASRPLLEGKTGETPVPQGHEMSGVPVPPGKPSLFSPPIDYTKQPHRWGMVIDLARCTGCSACVLACQSENNIPVVGKQEVAMGRQMHWIRVDRYFGTEPSEPPMLVQPVACVQCENAPCEQVCPVGATMHSSEGLNDMVYNRCVGTRYCSNNCPYKVRRFNWFNNHQNHTPVEKMVFNPDVTVRSRGVMEKCTYCVQRIEGARNTAKLAGQPLKDGAIEPACAQVCPADAIVFGDLNDPASAVSKQAQDPRAYGLLEHLNTKPRTQYLAKVWNGGETKA